MSVLGILSACCVLMVISKVSSSNGLQIEKRAAIVTAISSWDKKSTSKPLFSFRDDNVSYQVYSSYSSDGKYQGYFLQDNIKGSIPYAYSGSYLPTSPLELSELFEGEGATEFSDLSNKSGVSATTDFSSKRYICNPSNLVKYESCSQAFSYYLDSCPEYYNYPYGPVRNGCGPTAGAMLASFYHRYSSYNLTGTLLPLKHEDNKKGVDDLILTMAEYMDTISDNTTYYYKLQSGFSNYLNDHGCKGYTVSTSSSFSEYQDYLRNSQNPAMVFIPNHFVLGIGFSSTRPYPNIPSQNYLITHYGWDSRPGNYYVNTSEMKSFVYIWR